MKQLLLWLIGVALGVVVLLAAVLGVSYSFTSEGAKPASEVQFAGQELEPNGWCWQVPLLGGQVDKVFASPRTLTVQKLGVLYDAHPAFALPEWYSYGPLTITDSAGNVVFEGTAATYDDFLFPANGDYKAELTVWRLPENMLATQFEGGSTGELRRDVRLEKPAKPIGWYNYSFRFTLQASAEVELSAERMEQGGTVAAAFTGMVGETAPTVETDLGNVQAVRLGSGWRAYIPAAYNAAAGAHEVTFTVGGETVVKKITVIPKDFGTVEIEAEPEASEAANTEFRNAVWPLYEQPAREKLWSGGFACPAEGVVVGWQLPAVLLTDDAGGLLQVAHPAVVAQTLPELVELFFFARRQRGNVRQGGEEALIVWQRRRDAGLLQHDLAEPDVVGAGVGAEGQDALVLAEPFQQCRGDVFHLFCSPC